MDEKNNVPLNSNDETPDNEQNTAPTPISLPETPSATPVNSADGGAVEDENMDDRLERLGGEPAPVITPEEFARLQQAGQVHIDARGRVRTTRRSDSDAGVSLRKRRAWYAR